MVSGYYSRASTRNLKQLRVTDYLPKPNYCDPHTCFIAISWMLIECGFSVKEALAISRDFSEALNIQRQGILELVNTYNDGALTPSGGRRLIEEWMDCYERNNHYLLTRYLSALKKGLCEDGIARVDPILVVPEKYLQEAYPNNIWRRPSEAEKNKGVCPDPAFIESLQIPPQIAAWVEIEDTHCFLDDKHQVYHVSVTGY